MVARERFELSSAGPGPAMLDRYTTGLQLEILGFFVISLTLNIKEEGDTDCITAFHSVFTY
jgi:hypothetical protein